MPKHHTLTPSQLRAVTCNPTPTLVLAGPGSGKTTVIAHRIQYLIETLGVSPRDILVITFTKAAALEMKERFLRLYASDTAPAGVTFGTFHAIFFQILRAAYHYTPDQILKEDQRNRIIHQLATHLGICRGEEREVLQGLGGEISLVKNERIPIEHYYAKSCPAETFRTLLAGYQKALRSEGWIDFDDMLGDCYDLLLQRQDIRAAWQKRFPYLLVDEFQDINRLQYETLRLLAGDEPSIFAVGDDDQSIYRFRGARPEVLFRFQTDYPEAQRIILEDTFRCPPEILLPAMQVIQGNKARFPKELICAGSKDGVTELRSFVSPTLQEEAILSRIRSLAKSGVPYNEMAILTRTNALGRAYARLLGSHQIPFYSKERIPDLFDHWICTDLSAYLRLSQGPMRRADFLRVCNRPVRYISRDCVDKEVSFDRLLCYYEDKPWMAERITQLEEDLAQISVLPPFAAMNYIRRAMGYEDYVKEYASEHGIEEGQLTELLDELMEEAKDCQDAASWFEKTDQAKQKNTQGLSNGSQGVKHGQQRQDRDAVLLSTLHSAKGLEFTAVWLPDLNEKIIPASRVVLEADLEEERRLLYVGMTRAKKELHLFWVTHRHGKETEPSRLLMPLLQK